MFDKVVQHIMNPPTDGLSSMPLGKNNREESVSYNIRHASKKMKTNKNRSGYLQSVNEYLPSLLTSNYSQNLHKNVALKVALWETQSTQDMFDFESNKHVKVKQYPVDGDYDIYLSGMQQNERKQQNNRMKLKCAVIKAGAFNQSTFCGRVQTYKNSQYFTPGGTIDAYKAVSSQSQKPCIFNVGNTIKLGRMKYFVKQMYNGFEHKTENFQRQSANKKTQTHKELISLPTGSCKFCLCDETDNPDLLISPCGCKGSCAQVHVKCLQQWLVNKVSRKSTSVVQYLNYDNFYCELCKDQLPTTLKVNGQFFNMLKQQKEAKKQPYLILQGIPNQKVSTKNNLTITIKFSQNKKNLVVGRGHEADIRLEDVSISRQHCFISLKNKKFEIIDNKSKFGTLLQLNPGSKIQIGQEKIQIARMIIQIVDRKVLKAENKKMRENVAP